MPTAIVPALAATTSRIALADPVFISDLHLSSDSPRTLAAFVAFARTVAAKHAELLILGEKAALPFRVAHLCAELLVGDILRAPGIAVRQQHAVAGDLGQRRIGQQRGAGRGAEVGSE